ncbi:MAG: DNA primase [Flavobacteriales bacterium]|jgi:DNA primase|nr:DNA primase [Flavobacteriales bacterium]MDP7430077.1 DNA primase [Flavobacteriales bacterium]HJN63888.1 DNA primase [Flavobacteriales bacterium]|tara:strand:+ start:9343 stop:11226 length:1884 start_codon:yes stop_codon:yes gene_type:complete
MIPKETIDKIFEAARIEEVVSGFVQLKKRGANFIGHCPFHDEKTPSFTVSASKGIYKCFGCGKGGNSVSFVMEHEHYSYPEALKYLAEKYSIEVAEKELTPEQNIRANDRDSLYVISSFANKFFQQQLWEREEGKIVGLSYYKERGFTEETIKKFQLGYSPKQKDALSKEAIKSSFQQKYLEDSGLSIIKNKSALDRFRERMMFPIHSFSGRVLGFGGRTLQKDNKAKYVNSPESLIYLKSKILYGIYFAKQHISKQNNCFIVEGYTDVISLHQAGVENVVSSSGTSLTSEQIKLINRFTKNITILFDGDAAGLKASFRSIDMILAEGMNVKVVLFPDGEDPDSFAQKCSQEELINYLEENQKDFITFKTNILSKDTNEDPAKRVEMIKDIASSIAQIPDDIGRSEYIKECSRMLRVKELDLAKEVSAQKNKRISPFSAKSENSSNLEEKEIPTSKMNKEEKEIIRLLLNYGNKNMKEEDQKISIASFIIKELEVDNISFENEQYQSILGEISAHVKEDGEINLNYFTLHQNPSISKLAIDLISKKHSLSENWKSRHRILTGSEEDKFRKAVESSIYALKLKHLDTKLGDIQLQLKENPDDERFTKAYAKYLQTRRQIAEKLGRTMC